MVLPPELLGNATSTRVPCGRTQEATGISVVRNCVCPLHRLPDAATSARVMTARCSPRHRWPVSFRRVGANAGTGDCVIPGSPTAGTAADGAGTKERAAAIVV